MGVNKENGIFCGIRGKGLLLTIIAGITIALISVGGHVCENQTDKSVIKQNDRNKGNGTSSSKRPGAKSDVKTEKKETESDVKIAKKETESEFALLLNGEPYERMRTTVDSMEIKIECRHWDLAPSEMSNITLSVNGEIVDQSVASSSDLHMHGVGAWFKLDRGSTRREDKEKVVTCHEHNTGLKIRRTFALKYEPTFVTLELSTQDFTYKKKVVAVCSADGNPAPTEYKIFVYSTRCKEIANPRPRRVGLSRRLIFKTPACVQCKVEGRNKNLTSAFVLAAAPDLKTETDSASRSLDAGMPFSLLFIDFVYKVYFV